MKPNRLLLAASQKPERGHNSNSVDVRKLKAYVLKIFPEQSLLRELVLNEPDELDVRELGWKINTWLRVFNKEDKTQVKQ